MTNTIRKTPIYYIIRALDETTHQPLYYRIYKTPVPNTKSITIEAAIVTHHPNPTNPTIKEPQITWVSPNHRPNDTLSNWTDYIYEKYNPSIHDPKIISDLLNHNL